MKLCLLSQAYPPDVGGLAISARRTAQNLAAAGLDLHVSAPSESLPPGSWEQERDGTVTVHRFGAQRRARETLTDSFERMVELDQAEDFDLFHGHYVSYAAYVATLVARYRGKKSVVSARGNDIDMGPFDDRRAIFTHKALEWADAIVAVTEELARKATTLSGRRVRVIHNGVDADLFAPDVPDPALRESLGLNEGPVLGFIGEARAKKGLARLLRVYGRLCERLPVQLLLVGGVRKEDRPMVDFFRRQNPELPLKLVPPQAHDQILPYYALCDIVVLPSLRDGLPNSLLEAMACGRPVVASAVGGMLDVISDGHNGLLLPARDDDIWIETLHRLLLDTKYCKLLGQAARQTVLARFRPERELEAWLALYRELLPNKS